MADEEGEDSPKFRLQTTTDPFRRKLAQARQDGTLTDFRLVVNGTTIPCHKIVLSLQAEYFSRLLQHENTVEAAEGAVHIDGLEVDAVKYVIEFMYSGAVEFELSMVQEVIKVIDRFQLSDDTLKEALSDFISDKICASTCLGWRKFGEQMNLEDVVNTARSIWIEKFGEVTRGSEFVALSFEELTTYLQEALESQYTHDRCLQAFVTWAMAEADYRKDKLEEVLTIVDLKQCSAMCLKDVYDHHGTQLFHSLDLLHKFTAALSGAAPADSVILAGGVFKCFTEYATDKPNHETWLMDLKSGKFIDKAFRENALLFSAICPSTDGLICAGGTAVSGYSEKSYASCALYHKGTNTWEDLPDLPFPATGVGATCVREDFLMVVGGDGDNKSKAVLLDFRTGIWTVCDDMLQGLEFPVVGAVDDCVFVIFSTTDQNKRNSADNRITVQCYDTTTGKWSYRSALPDSITETCGALAVTLSGCLYLIGADPKCAYYDPDSDEWTVITPPHHEHSYGFALVRDGKIILSGGYDRVSYSNIIEEYDPATDAWRVLPVKLPKPLCHHCMIQA